MSRAARFRLSPTQLTHRLPGSWLPFKTTTVEITSYPRIIGQERAMRAVEVGLTIPTRGFNIFAAGEPGSGKTSTLERLLRERAAVEPVPDDLCYVHNFAEPDCPRPILLPPGQGKRLERDMARVMADLVRMVPRVLSDGAFGHVQTRVLAETHGKAQKLFRRVSRAAESLGLRIHEEESGLQVMPTVEGKPLDQEAYEQLSRRQRQKIEANMVAFQEHLDSYSYARRQLEEDHAKRQTDAEVRAITPLLARLFAEIRAHYDGMDEVLSFLKDAEEHVLDNHHALLPAEPREDDSEEAAPPSSEPRFSSLRLYEVNVVVDRSKDKGAPVVTEPVPNAANLSGCFEYRMEQGRLVTDHTMIRAGALHRANGGYLLLQVNDLLSQENGWETLKRSLRHKNIRVEEEVGLMDGRVRVAGSKKPGTVPLKVKAVLVGSQEAYYSFRFTEEDFSRLFKIKADFESSMPRTRHNVERLARFIGKVCLEEGYLPVHRSGVSRLVELASRRAEHKLRMTTHRAELLDILAEADFYARTRRARAIRQADVEQALREVEHRHSAVPDAVDRAITEGTIQIRTRGAAIGQVNGIALYDMAATSFGVPVRITVRVYAGRRGVVNIDREVSLSGAIHDKGALILVGYLGGRFARQHTLALSASVTFEQSYDEIDGDSASSAELYALLSALSGCPIRQGIAVTGSVNQLGEVQQIGGVNEKIEGIFRVCEKRGLTGEEGVLIPQSSVKNLMLNGDVIAGVREHKFHIYAVATVDEGVEVLTGVPAGRRRKDGWTPGSINDRVQRRLRQLNRVIREENITMADDRLT